LELNKIRCIFAAVKETVIRTMFAYHKLTLLVLPFAFLSACSTGQDKNADEKTEETHGLTDEPVSVVFDVPEAKDENLVIQSEPYSTTILKDADGNISHISRPLLRKNELLKVHYQRVGCVDDTCKQEWITFTAIQYPKDSILQRWAADVVGRFYYDASRDLDIKVNGEKTEANADGEMVIKNVGLSPYVGILANGEKAMFDYYQARLWCIGKNRGAEHGPAGRYGCILYRCWQSKDVASYFLAYSTDPQMRTVHQVASFDRHTGKELSLSDVIRDDYVAEFNDLVVDAARQRHFELLHSKNSELAIDSEAGDYSSLVAVNHVGFVENGLAVSTDALPFDQWAYASHILIIPYEKVNHLLLDRFRR